MKTFFSHFLKIDNLNKKCLSKINVKNSNNFLPNKNIFLGYDSENFIKVLPKNNIEQIKSKIFFCTLQ